MVVDVDAPDVVEESAVDEELVDAGRAVVGLVTATAVVAEDESLLLLHAAMASAATMNVVVDLVYFTVSLSSADALFERGSVPNMCSSPGRQ